MMARIAPTSNTEAKVLFIRGTAFRSKVKRYNSKLGLSWRLRCDGNQKKYALKQSREPCLCSRDAEKDQNNDDQGNAEEKPCAPFLPLSTKRLAIVVRDNGRREHKPRLAKCASVFTTTSACPNPLRPRVGLPARFCFQKGPGGRTTQRVKNCDGDMARRRRSDIPT